MFLFPSLSYQSPVYTLAHKEPSVEETVHVLFEDKAPVALAIIQAESNSEANKIGYNCRYGAKTTVCAPEDRKNAVSVDCGLWQINEMHYGTDRVCPPESFDPIQNTMLAKKIYDEREKRSGDGFDAWWAYRDNKHKKFLE